MDTRWKPFNQDSQRRVRILLYQTSSIRDVRLRKVVPLTAASATNATSFSTSSLTQEEYVIEYRQQFVGDGTADTFQLTYAIQGIFRPEPEGAVGYAVVDINGFESMACLPAPPDYLWEYDPVTWKVHRRLGPPLAGQQFSVRYDALIPMVVTPPPPPVDKAEADDFDISAFVKEASHTVFSAQVTLTFNRELTGGREPKPNQVLEIQLWQNYEWKPLWIGLIDSISSFTLSRGERQLQLSAKTRDQQDIWRSVRRVTQLFPQLTNLNYIMQTVARACDLKSDEIALPPTAVMTAHANTQMADMTAWDMISEVCVALGWTPWIDGLGRLRAADRSLQNRTVDIKVSTDRMVKVGGQRVRPSVSRVRVSWLNPSLVRWQQQHRMLTSVPVTIGWYIKTHTERVRFSPDGTQRAEKTEPRANPSIEKWSAADWCDVSWTQEGEAGGNLFFDNTSNFVAYTILAASWIALTAASSIPGAGGAAAVPQAAFLALLLKMGPGVYEIWGTPYDYVHAKNVSEAFDSSSPSWVDNPLDVSCDYVLNEEHARAIAVRELIYSAWSASKWTVSIVDDPRIEYGDLLEFPDGTRMFVEDFTRPLTRGSEGVLEVKGFVMSQQKWVPPPPAGSTGTGTGSETDPFVAMSADPVQIAIDVHASYLQFSSPLIAEEAYWVDKASSPKQFSNGVWYLGWNKYWEDRMDQNNPGFPVSADPTGGYLPALYRAS